MRVPLSGDSTLAMGREHTPPEVSSPQPSLDALTVTVQECNLASAPTRLRALPAHSPVTAARSSLRRGSRGDQPAEALSDLRARPLRGALRRSRPLAVALRRLYQYRLDGVGCPQAG